MTSRARCAALVAGTLALTGCNPSSLDGFDLPRPAGSGGASGSSGGMDASAGAGGTNSGGNPPLPGSGGSGGSGGRTSIADASSDSPAVDSGVPPNPCPLRDPEASDAIGVTVAERATPQSRPLLVRARDGAASGRLPNGEVLWLFHETWLTQPAEDNSIFRVATAAAGRVDDPLSISEPLDVTGAPRPFLEYNEEELRTVFGDASRGFITLWPNTLVVDGDAQYVLYVKAVLADSTYDYVGTGVARPRAAAPTRSDRSEGLLFDSSKGDYVFHAGGFTWPSRGEEHLYLYGCVRGREGVSPCRVARAPRARWSSRAAYTFWDGMDWVADVTKAAGVFNDGPLEPTVSFNRYLQRFVAVYTIGFDKAVYMRTAPAPEGPWSERQTLFSFVAGEDIQYAYGAKEHPELSPDCGRTLIVTYPKKLPNGASEIRVVDVTLD